MFLSNRSVLQVFPCQLMQIPLSSFGLKFTVLKKTPLTMASVQVMTEC